MGMRRTLLRKQGRGFVTKKNRVGDHKITDKKAVILRRSTSEIRGTKTLLERIGVPKHLIGDMWADEQRDVRYHFTKGWRIHKVRNA